MTFAGLLVFLFLIIVRPQDFVSSLMGKPVVFVAMATVLPLWFLGGDDRALVRTRVDRFAYLYFAAICVSTLSTRWITYIFTQTIETMKIALCYLFVVSIADTWKRFRTATWAIVLFMSVVAGMGVLQHYGIDITGIGMAYARDKEVWQIRGAGNFDNPNDLAYSVVIILPFALNLLLTSPNLLKKAVGAALAGLAVYCIYLTNSRGGALALVACFGSWVFLWTKNATARGFMLLGAAGAFLFVASTLAAGYHDDASSMGRINAWVAGMDLLREHPLIGVGKGQFIEFHERDAHSSFVRAGAEMGVLGLYAWVGMVLFSVVSL
ncbi:MAG: O-antigen ligase family protein, partial [Deltaproteobacteria bacterium]|nr:O-antigen ligase family protein [Deltaproteobacteria bacterium]